MESDDENQDHQKPKKLYKCNLCEKKFTRKKNRNTHQLSHTAKNFKCDKCDESFIEIGRLNHHYMNLHEGINYCCKLCNLEYTAKHKRTMATHLKTKHENIVGKNVNWEAVQQFLLKQ